MKFAAVLCVLLVVSSVFGVRTPHKITNADIRKINELKKSGTWGQIAINLAELHSLAQGPLEELVEALNKLIADLNDKLQRAHQNFNDLTDAYNAEVNRLQGEIDSAKSDIANTEILLNEVLYVQRDQLNLDIENLNTSIANTYQYLDDLAAERAADHKAYLRKVEEANGAIAAIDECLQLLSTLSGAASLAEVNKAKNSLTKVQEKLPKRSVEATMIKALLNLSTSEFADSEAVQKVMEMMMNVKGNLENAIEQFGQEEAAAQAAYEEEVKLKNDEINAMKTALEEKIATLETTENMIQENEAFLALRKKDLIGFEKDLEAVNAKYEQDTATYNDLVAELNKELDACGQALDIIQNADFAGYIEDRVGAYEDTVIDQAHGEEIPI